MSLIETFRGVPASAPPSTGDAALFALIDDLSAAEWSFGVHCDAHDEAFHEMCAWGKQNPRPTMRDHITDADLKVAAAEYEAAARQWGAERKAAKDACRYDELKAAWQSALAELDRLVDAIAETPAHTVEGLVRKAMLGPSDNEAVIAVSVMANVLTLFGTEN